MIVELVYGPLDGLKMDMPEWTPELRMAKEPMTEASFDQLDDLDTVPYHCYRAKEDRGRRFYYCPEETV